MTEKLEMKYLPFTGGKFRLKMPFLPLSEGFSATDHELEYNLVAPAKISADRFKGYPA